MIKWTLLILTTLIGLNSWAGNTCLELAQRNEKSLRHEAVILKDGINSTIQNLQNIDVLYLIGARTALKRISGLEQLLNRVNQPNELQSSHHKTLKRLCEMSFDFDKYIGIE